MPSERASRAEAIALVRRERSEPEDERLIDALEQYLELAASGRAPAVEAFVQLHPTIAERLLDCLSGLRLVQQAAPEVEASAASLGQLAEQAIPFTEPLGDYRVVREVGRGGMGIVYEAQQLSLGRRVAVKTLPLAAVLDPRQLQRFKNEAQAAAHLDHPNIVEVYGVGCERGIHFFAMKFVDGPSLADVIQARRREETSTAAEKGADSSLITPHSSLPAETLRAANSVTLRDAGFFASVARLGIQAAEALDHAHQMGVIHRDVKPSNLMLDAGGKVWVTDFGLARIGVDAQFTMTGDLLGTLRYMSPEQASGRPTMIDHRTDIYSLGATLYELATDRSVVRGQERAAMLREIAETDPAHPRTIAPSMSLDLETILLKTLAKEPAARYDSAQALADDLRRFLEHKPVLARRATRWDQTTKWVRRHRAVSALLAVVVGAVMLLLSGALWHNVRLREEIAKSDARNFELRELAYQRDIPRVNVARLEGKLAIADDLLSQHVPRPGEPDVRDFLWYWLNRALHDEKLVLRGHEKAVTAVQYNVAGSRIATGGDDGTVRIWDANSGQQLRLLAGHHGNVNCLQFLKDDAELLSGGDDGLIRHWRVSDGQVMPTFRGHVGDVLSLSVSADERWLATGGEDRVLRIWDLDQAKLVRSVIDANDWIRAVRFSPIGSHLAVGSRDGFLRLYRYPDWELMWKRTRPFQNPLSLTFDRAGLNLLVGDEAGHVNYLNVATGERVFFTLSQGGKKRAVALRRGDRHFLAVDFDGRLYQDPVDTPRSVPHHVTHASRVWAASLSPDERCLATAGADGTARVWRLDQPTGGDVMFTAKSETMSHFMSADGQVMGCCTDGHIHLWHVADWRPMGTLVLDQLEKRRSCISADGQLLAVNDQSHNVWLIDARTMRANKVGNAGQWINQVQFQPRGRWLAVLTQRGATFFDVLGELPARFLPCNSANSLAFSPDGKSFAICRYDEDRLTAWDTDTLRERFSIEEGVNRRVAYSSDGQLLACARRDGSILLRDANSGVLQLRLDGGRAVDSPNQLAFSPDGRLIAIGDADHGLRLISVAAKKELLKIDEMLDVSDVKFAPDGKSLWTTCNDGETCSLVRWSIELPSKKPTNHINLVPSAASDGSRL